MYYVKTPKMDVLKLKITSGGLIVANPEDLYVDFYKNCGFIFSLVNTSTGAVKKVDYGDLLVIYNSSRYQFIIWLFYEMSSEFG